MPTPRRLLWIGPASADLRARAIAHRGEDHDGLWIVATPLAREQLLVALTRRKSSPSRPRVFAWDDLWTEVARGHQRAPAILSEATERAVLVAAIERARRADELGAIERVADVPGLRRELRALFDMWTLADRHPDGPAPGTDGVTVAEWSVYRHYRAILAETEATDAAGLAEWASRAIADAPSMKAASVTILEPVAPSKPQRRVIEWATAADVLVTLPWHGEADDPAVGPMWEALTQELGFDDEEFDTDSPPTRAGGAWVGGRQPQHGRGTVAEAGLSHLETTLFELDPSQPRLGPIDGLSILGGPEGEGLGLILAREAARRLDAGISPDDMLILVPRWDDDAARAIEILDDAGIPITGAAPRPLASDPAVAALLLAAGLAAGGWEATAIVRLLRNGAIDPGWADAGVRGEAASAIASLRVFRSRPAIASALDREGRHDDRRRVARAVFDRLALTFDGPPGPASWADQCDRLRAMADSLGLASSGIDALWDAVDDHALISDLRTRPIDRAGFLSALEWIARDLPRPASPTRPGSIRFATIAEAEGTRARVLFVTNLAEGTFPSRASVAGETTDEGSVPLAYARERLAMLRLIGSVEDELLLLVPTSDDQGRERLAAGFVEDIRRRLGAVAGHPRFAVVRRLDPAFREHPDLAVTPAARRVLAVARACVEGKTDDLLALARDPIHRVPLEGIARAMRLAHERWRVRGFTRFDGMLGDAKVVAQVAAALGPGHAFTASQLESFALCPFQFFLRHVLRFEPIDDRPELRVDMASRGERLHAILEEIHAAIAAEGRENRTLGERLAHFIRARTAEELDDDAAEVAGALRFLEEMDLRKVLENYEKEFLDYAAASKSARPEHFEWSFGLDPDRPDAEPTAPALEIVDGGQTVRLRGKIDRIDRLAEGFRVIDYKTGHAVKPVDVHTHLRAVQLPLYALAVETLLHGGPVDSCDFGYWNLGRDGFAPVKLKGGWPEFKGRVVEEVARLVGQLRSGAFPVAPTNPDCRRFCEYKIACRVGQMIEAGKVRADGEDFD
ncbi:MAG TPA: PD-(D/E)XK nuclease family protein [Isosphaeraceae bacterium]